MPDPELQFRKPEACPKCHASDVRRIIYGIPTMESLQMVQRGEAALGGCFIAPWIPDWRCGGCRHEWFVADDPAKQEVERLLQTITQDARAKNPAPPKGPD